MTDRLDSARAAYAAAIADAVTAEAALGALHDLARAVCPARLFTVTLTDLAAGVARRAYSSDPVAYPVSGTKPIGNDRWFERIHIERQTYVNNDIATDKEHFGDYDLIVSLGCEAAANLPVVIHGELVGTVNILDARDSYPPATVARIEAELRVPAMLSLLVATRAPG
ncbi:MAG: GAF domain-containing protein [Rubellimicrobium sp.]|nr:GAF domain-containing protein [Rubellimicrobium sp.]